MDNVAEEENFLLNVFFLEEPNFYTVSEAKKPTDSVLLVAGEPAKVFAHQTTKVIKLEAYDVTTQCSLVLPLEEHLPLYIVVLK